MNNNYVFENDDVVLGDFDTQHRKLPIVLCIDVSSSMESKLDDLNNALRELYTSFKADIEACKSVEIAIVAFSTKAKVWREFESIDESVIPAILEVGGCTVMSEALSLSLETAEKRKKYYQSKSLMYYQPWIFFLTDGHPYIENEETTNIERRAINAVIKKINQLEENSKLLFYSFGIGDGVDYNLMKKFSVAGAARYKHSSNSVGLNKMFMFLIQTQKKVSQSDTGDPNYLDSEFDIESESDKLYDFSAL